MGKSGDIPIFATEAHRREVDVRKCNGLVRGTLILKHRGLGAECAWRFCFAVLQQLLRPILFGWEHCPTVFLHRPLVMSRLPFGLPTLDRFPQFSAIARKWPSIAIQVMPKTAEIDQTWPWSPAHWHKKYDDAMTYPHQTQLPLTRCVRRARTQVCAAIRRGLV